MNPTIPETTMNTSVMLSVLTAVPLASDSENRTKRDSTT